MRGSRSSARDRNARRSSRGRRRTASRTPSPSSATATTSRRGSPTPTSSCCPRDPSRSRTRSSKRWPRACRSSRPDVGGILELIEDGRTGWLVPPGEDEALASRVMHLMANPAEGARVGAAAREAVLARFSFDRMVAALRRHLSHRTRPARRRARRSFPTGGLLTCAALLESWRSTDSIKHAASRALRMRDVITHRGPDEAGLHCDSHAALAHRRLSIVDLSRASSRCRTRTAASG